MSTVLEFLHLKSGQRVTLSGWAQTVRNQKRMQFVVLRVSNGHVQLVHERGTNSAVEIALDSLTPESTLSVTGIVSVNPSVKLGGIEIPVESVEVHSIAQSLPIDSETAFERQMDYRWINLRDPRTRLIFEIQTTAERAMREYWAKHGFIEIHSPKLMAQASENSGAELFVLEYFGRTATLAQSPQWYKQMAMASGFDRVFEIGPVFRANPSMTSRHDTEFTSVDVEMSWIDSYEDLMTFEERWLQHVLFTIAGEHGPAIMELYGLNVVVPTLPFPKISLSDASALIARMGYTVPPETKGDLDPQAERMLGEYFQQELGHDFVFVTDYPASVRAFYHMRPDGHPDLTNSFDLLYRGLEVTTGAQREHRIERLTQQAVQKGIDPRDIDSYLQFFRYGVPPHGGFGFGLTRLLMKLLGLKNVREVTYVYRGINRLNP
jgi:aspartyl/asparaginyl-tRNA synthetase